MYITQMGTIVIHPHIYSVTGQQVRDLDENIDCGFILHETAGSWTQGRKASIPRSTVSLVNKWRIWRKKHRFDQHVFIQSLPRWLCAGDDVVASAGKGCENSSVDNLISTLRHSNMYEKNSRDQAPTARLEQHIWGYVPHQPSKRRRGLAGFEHAALVQCTHL